MMLLSRSGGMVCCNAVLGAASSSASCSSSTSMAAARRVIPTWSSLLRSGDVRRALATSNHGAASKVLPADSLMSWDTRVPVRLRMGPDAPGNLPPTTVPDMLADVASRHPERACLKIKRGGVWQEWNYAKFLSDVRSAAKGFQRLGLRPHHGVGMIGPNVPEWAISGAGAIFAGGLSVGIYATNSPQLVSYICGHAPLDVLVVADRVELTRVLSADDRLAGVRAFVLMEGDKDASSSDDRPVLTWSELMELGGAEDDAALDRTIEDMGANQACMLIYTSGTTGPPKGTILSHDNITWSSAISMHHYEWDEADEVVMSFLPLSHVAAQLIDLYMNMSVAGTCCFADKDALKGTLVDNLKEIRPTRFWAVPRVFEKIKEKMQEVGRSNTGLKKALGEWAKSAAAERRADLRRGIDKETLSYKLARKLVLGRIHEALGFDRLKKDPHAGGAPIDDATVLYFESLDLGLTGFYGMTEATGPITTNMTGPEHRLGSVGKPYWGVGVDILDVEEGGVGEMAFNSRNAFMGYHKQEKETRSTITESGWVRTGDQASIDEDGFYTIRGRLKELLVTSGGENVAPVPIEDEIKAQLSQVVSNAVVIGDRRKFLSCLLTVRVEVDPETQAPTDRIDPVTLEWIGRVLNDKDHGFKTVQDFYSKPGCDALKAQIWEGVQRANERAVSNAQKVQKFRLLPGELSQSGGELGPTLKTKRFFVHQKYAHLIDQMYKED